MVTYFLVSSLLSIQLFSPNCQNKPQSPSIWVNKPIYLPNSNAITNFTSQ